MYVSDAITQLGLRVEDADKKKFPEKLRREVLEYSQVKIANMLHNAYLTELEYLVSNKTASPDVYLLSSLPYKVLRGAEGILKVKLTSGRYCTRIDIKDLKRLENTYIAGTDDNPLYYVFEDKIYVKTTVTEPHIDIYYLKLPLPLYYPFTITTGMDTTKFTCSYFSTTYEDDYFNGALLYCLEKGSYHIVTKYTKSSNTVEVLPAAGTAFITNHHFYLLHHPTVDVELIALSATSFDLNDSLEDLILDYAESELWKITADIDRRNSTLEKVISQIKTLNDKYRVAEGIGTQKKGVK